MKYLVNILLLSNAYVDDIIVFLVKSGYAVKSGYKEEGSFTLTSKDVPAVLLTIIIENTQNKNSSTNTELANVQDFLLKNNINYYFLSILENTSGTMSLGKIKETPKKIIKVENKSNVFVFPVKNNDKPIELLDDEEVKRLAQLQLEHEQKRTENKELQ